MIKNQRLEQILHILSERQYISVRELAAHLFVSEATVRRDIAALEKDDLILKSYGGISLNEGKNRFVRLNLRAVAHEAEKAAIAKAAAAYVTAGDALFLDGSSTVLNMLPFLVQKNLTVLTNSLRVADLMSETDARVYLTGGELLKSSNVFVGSVAEKSLRSFHADKLFFSATGVSGVGDISDYSEMEAYLRQIMIKRSAQQYFLCDASKFEKSYLFHIANTQQITTVISETEYCFENGTRATTGILNAVDN